MKKLVIISTVFVALTIGTTAIVMACGGDGKTTASKQVPKGAKVVVLEVKGMTCGGCANSIAEKLSKVTGVFVAKVNFDKKQAKISYHPKKTSVKKLITAVKKLGYKASVRG